MVEERDEIIIVQAKDNSPPPEEGLPPWMATFADMVTLLLCFFVLLLSFANQDISNFEMLKGSMKEAFGVQKAQINAKKTPWASSRYEGTSKVDTHKLMGLAMKLRSFVEERKIKNRAKVTTDQAGVTLRVSSLALFKPGSAVLLPASRDVLLEVINTLKKNPEFNLIVQGNTDNVKPKGGRYNSNWVLSSERAAAALDYILHHSNVSPNRLKAVGFADSKPLLPNTSERNRHVNRRVEFYFVPKDREGW